MNSQKTALVRILYGLEEAICEAVRRRKKEEAWQEWEEQEKLDELNASLPESCLHNSDLTIKQLVQIASVLDLNISIKLMKGCPVCGDSKYTCGSCLMKNGGNLKNNCGGEHFKSYQRRKNEIRNWQICFKNISR